MKVSVDFGSADDLENSDVCEFIRRNSGVEGRKVGRIIMEAHRTFIEVDPECADRVCKGLSEYDLDGRPIHAKRCDSPARQ